MWMSGLACWRSWTRLAKMYGLRRRARAPAPACLLACLLAGQLTCAMLQDFDALRPQWMAEKDGYLFVFSMDSSHSLAQLEPFFELHQQINENAHVPIVLVANKKDLVVRAATHAPGPPLRLNGSPAGRTRTHLAGR